MALNQEKYLDDFTWKELNDVINFIRKAEGSASDHSYAECATREYISVFENVFDAENWVGCFEAIQHAYDISIRLGKKSTSFLQVRETINSALKKWTEMIRCFCP